MPPAGSRQLSVDEGAKTRASEAGGPASSSRFRETRVTRSFEARIVLPMSGARSTEALHHKKIMAVIEPLGIWASPLRPIQIWLARQPSENRQVSATGRPEVQPATSFPNVRPTTARSPWIAVRCM